jgi:MFS family permease
MSSLVTIDYYGPSSERYERRAKLLRCLAGFLAMSAVAAACYAWWNRWGVNFFCGIAMVAAIALALRSCDRRSRLPRRTPWCMGIVAFALWTILVLANQFHGRPPASDLYLLAGLAVCCSASVIGMLFEMPKPSERLVPPFPESARAAARP